MAIANTSPVEGAVVTLTRRRYLLASGYDLGALTAALIAVCALAVGWLLVRTHGGRLDAGTVDTEATVALLAAVLPAWTAWQLAHVRLQGRSPGRAHAGLAPTASRPRSRPARALRLPVYPATAPAWAWLALALLLLGVPWLPLGAAALAGAALLWGLGSFAVVLVRGPRRG